MSGRAPLLAAWLLLAAAPLEAAELRYWTSSGESFESIAERHYGQADLGPWLRSLNDGAVEPLPAGAELRLPSATRRSASAGESWALLAERWLEEPALAGPLAELNGSALGEPPPARVRVPALVPYTVREGDSLARISRRFYGTPDRALLLARLNGVERPEQIEVGRRLRVPLIRVVGPALPVSAPASGEALRDGLREAIHAYLNAHYDTALEALLELREEVLAGGSRREQRELLRYLAFTYVAYGRPEPACDCYRSLSALEPELRWDPDLVSPAILSVFASCQDR